MEYQRIDTVPKTVFDLGMNDGQDTRHYLEFGYNVVAVEADPYLCEQVTKELHSYIENGRLEVLNTAIADTTGYITFYINKNMNHWSSTIKEFATKNGTMECSEIVVPTTTLNTIIKDKGCPEYIKCDIEGMDLTAINQLSFEKIVPQYFSVEDCRLGFNYVEILHSIGYEYFTIVDQSSLPKGSSGNFGLFLTQSWETYNKFLVTYENTVRGRDLRRKSPSNIWWDIHCMLPIRIDL